MIEQTKDLSSVVLHGALSILLQTESTTAQAQAALVSCQKQHDHDLLKQVKYLVKKCDPEDQEPRKGGRLKNSDSKLGRLLSKAQQWIALHRFEAAFQLVWACVERASGYEERGSWSWEKWDTVVVKSLYPKPVLAWHSSCATTAQPDWRYGQVGLVHHRTRVWVGPLRQISSVALAAEL